MFWDKKSGGSGLPDLPPLNRSESSSNMKMSSNQRADISNFSRFSNQEDAPSFPEESSEMPEPPRPRQIPGFNPNSSFKTTETQSYSQMPSKIDMSNDEEEDQEPMMSPPPTQSRRISSPPEMSSKKVKNDIFVKIDKFQSARKSLMAAQDQMKEIENLLKKIREVRMREDQELSAWEKDLSETKSRIEEVSQNLFDKIE